MVEIANAATTEAERAAGALERRDQYGHLRNAEGRMIYEIFALPAGEQVGCYYCMADGWRGEQLSYKRGEAYLCGAECPPCDANANYICKEHAPTPHVVVDLYDKERLVVVTRQGTDGHLRYPLDYRTICGRNVRRGWRTRLARGALPICPACLGIEAQL